MQEGGRFKDEVSPSLANLHQFIPPALMNPIIPQNNTLVCPLKNAWSREIKYIEKGVIVEVVGQCLALPAGPQAEHGTLTC
jgi:hypothetical protein